MDLPLSPERVAGALDFHGADPADRREGKSRPAGSNPDLYRAEPAPPRPPLLLVSFPVRANKSDALALR